MVDDRRLHRVEDVAEPSRIALRGLAGEQRGVLEEHCGDELGMVLGDPPRDDAPERVPDEQRRATTSSRRTATASAP